MCPGCASNEHVVPMIWGYPYEDDYIREQRGGSWRVRNSSLQTRLGL